MPRKKNGARSVKRDKKTSQLLERGETPGPDEVVDPEVGAPGEITGGGGPSSGASLPVDPGERYSTLGGGVYSNEGAPEDAPRQRGWARHGTGGTSRRRKTDDSLASEIHEILTGDPELDANDIEVVVEAGDVTLSGEVAHPDARLLAEELTESVAGVRLVHNRLVVRR